MGCPVGVRVSPGVGVFDPDSDTFAQARDLPLVQRAGPVEAERLLLLELTAIAIHRNACQAGGLDLRDALDQAPVHGGLEVAHPFEGAGPNGCSAGFPAVDGAAVDIELVGKLRDCQAEGTTDGAGFSGVRVVVERHGVSVPQGGDGHGVSLPVV